MGRLRNKDSSHLNTNINLFVHVNQGKEGKPHGTKPSLRNGHGMKLAKKIENNHP